VQTVAKVEKWNGKAGFPSLVLEFWPTWRYFKLAKCSSALEPTGSAYFSVRREVFSTCGSDSPPENQTAKEFDKYFLCFVISDCVVCDPDLKNAQLKIIGMVSVEQYYLYLVCFGPSQTFASRSSRSSFWLLLDLAFAYFHLVGQQVFLLACATFAESKPLKK